MIISHQSQPTNIHSNSMATTMKPGSTSSNGTDASEKQRLLDRDIRDMISTLTSRLSDFQGGGNPSDEDQSGSRIITLAGTNVGATMKGQQETENHSRRLGQYQNQNQNQEEDENEDGYTSRTLVNSNFQAINNSIMMGGSYSANDPGVHIEVTDYLPPINSHNTKLSDDKEKKKKKTEKVTEGGDEGRH